MIADPQALRDLAEELATLSLDQRRKYIADVEKAQGESAAEQIKGALKALWDSR